MGGAMKYFLKKLLGHEIFRCPGLRIFFLKNLKNPPPPTPVAPSPPLTYLMYPTSLNYKLYLECSDMILLKPSKIQTCVENYQKPFWG